MYLTNDTVHAFAKARHKEMSFPFLKENGELLSLASTAQMLIEPKALKHYKDFYSQAISFNETYPQYYRFTLRICLDLEDLGLTGHVGKKLCNYVRENHFLDYDTSDSRRLETLSLLRRRLKPNTVEKEHRLRLLDNIDWFIAHPHCFSRLNKPFFYELTHIIFFLTEYGSTSWPLSRSGEDCIKVMGALAFLDNDCDLLAEVCICYSFLGLECPQLWVRAVDDNLAALEIRYDTDVKSTLNSSTDEYHPYIVMNWRKALKHEPCFTERFEGRRPNFILSGQETSILSKLSERVHDVRFNKSSKLLAQENFYQDLTEEEAKALEALQLSDKNINELLKDYSYGVL